MHAVTCEMRLKIPVLDKVWKRGGLSSSFGHIGVVENTHITELKVTEHCSSCVISNCLCNCFELHHSRQIPSCEWSKVLSFLGLFQIVRSRSTAKDCTFPMVTGPPLHPNFFASYDIRLKFTGIATIPAAVAFPRFRLSGSRNDTYECHCWRARLKRWCMR